MSNLQTELGRCRERWIKAAREKDGVCMILWEKVGRSLKRQIAERMGQPPDIIAVADQIFNGENPKKENPGG